MAIIKQLESKVGVNLEYHKIIGINLNFRDKKAVICVASYISKEKRDNNYEPLEIVDIEVPVADFAIFNGKNIRENSYLWLKDNIDGFDNSVDN